MDIMVNYSGCRQTLSYINELPERLKDSGELLLLCTGAFDFRAESASLIKRWINTSQDKRVLIFIGYFDGKWDSVVDNIAKAFDGVDLSEDEGWNRIDAYLVPGFHAKLLAVYSERGWGAESNQDSLIDDISRQVVEALIGSSNITCGAESSNYEMDVIINRQDDLIIIKEKIRELLKSAIVLNGQNGSNFERTCKLNSAILNKLYPNRIPRRNDDNFSDAVRDQLDREMFSQE